MSRSTSTLWRPGRQLPGPPRPLKRPSYDGGLHPYGTEYPRKRARNQLKGDFYIQSTCKDPDTQLCHRCESIDFDSIFQTDGIKSTGVPVFDVGPIREGDTTNMDSRCALCDFFINTLNLALLHSTDKDSWLRRRWHLRCYGGLEAIGVNSSKSRRNLVPSKVLTLQPGSSIKALTTRERHNMLSGNLILRASHLCNSESESSEQLLTGRIIGTSLSSDDFRLFRQWVKDCTSAHTTCGKPKPPCGSWFKVIDCSTRRIVPLPPGTDYIALSYVWGPQSKPSSQDPAKRIPYTLPDELPKSIEDALRVSLGLEKQYLWVDRYCIDQYHNEDKQQQIDAMADIYEGAWVTIVGLGPNDCAGLPGVTCARIWQQPYVKIREHRLVSSMPSLQFCLRSAPWSSRAWTMQEGRLSSRCLVFTDFQVYFTCGIGTVCQAFPFTGPASLRSNRVWRESPLNPTLLDPIQHGERRSRKSTRLPSYWHPETEEPIFSGLLSEYRRRKMSQMTDALNAFKGILARVDQASFWGVPVFNGYREGPYWRDWVKGGSTECGFAIGLLWTWTDLRHSPESWLKHRERNEVTIPTRRSRIANLPTWSWASTHGEIVLFHTSLYRPRFLDTRRQSELTYKCNDILFHAAISVYGDETGPPLPLKHFEEQQLRQFPLRTLRLHIRGPMATWRRGPGLPDDQHFIFNVRCQSRIPGISEWGNQAVAFVDPESFGTGARTDSRFWRTNLRSILILCVPANVWLSTYWLIIAPLDPRNRRFKRVGIIRASAELSFLDHTDSLQRIAVDVT